MRHAPQIFPDATKALPSAENAVTKGSRGRRIGGIEVFPWALTLSESLARSPVIATDGFIRTHEPHYELPISTPAAKTSPPPTMTCSALSQRLLLK